MASVSIEKKQTVTHLENMPEYNDLENALHITPSTAAHAKAAADDEHNLTLAQAIKRYPQAIMWSMLVSAAVVMEGYDIVLVTSLFAQPAFSQRFGEEHNGKYAVAGPWQAVLASAPTIGAVFGALANGSLTARFGYRRTLLTSLVAMEAFIFLLFFAVNLPMLLVGLICCGVPWGVFATMAPAYASEVCPLALRGYLTVFVNLCWALGQLVAAGVLEGFADGTDQWAYRIPFGIQWAWPIPILICVWFAPESPWWLVRRGENEKALNSLRKLRSGKADVDDAAALAMIQHTNEIENEVQSGTSYIDCFKGIDLRRTEIACIAFASQIFCGIPMGGTPAYFFVQAGLSPSVAFQFSVGGLGLASVGTIVAWFLMSGIGRRTLYNWGLALLTLIMLFIGVASAISNNQSSTYAQASLILIFLLTYYLTVGPVCYAVIAEASAVRLRNKSICLSRIAYYIAQIIGNVIYPFMINPGEGNWKGRTGFFWAGTCFVCFLWSYFRLPETKDRSFEELNILFEEKISARKFIDYDVDAYVADRTDRLKRRK